jgi:hypothetical protein
VTQLDFNDTYGIQKIDGQCTINEAESQSVYKVVETVEKYLIEKEGVENVTLRNQLFPWLNG